MEKYGRKLCVVNIFYNNNNNNNDWLEKDGGTKNCIYKDYWFFIQGLVSAY